MENHGITVNHESVLGDFCMDFSGVQILGSDSGFRKSLTDTGSTCKPETQTRKFVSGSLSGAIWAGMFKENEMVCGESSG